MLRRFLMFFNRCSFSERVEKEQLFFENLLEEYVFGKNKPNSRISYIPLEELIYKKEE